MKKKEEQDDGMMGTTTKVTTSRIALIGREKGLVMPKEVVIRGSSEEMSRNGLSLVESVISLEEAASLRVFLVDVLDRGRRGESGDASGGQWHYSAPPPAFARRKQSREMVSFGSVSTSSNRVVQTSSSIVSLPPLLSMISARLVELGALDSFASAVSVNYYENDNWVPPHIDAESFRRPFAVLSLDPGQVAFGAKLERDDKEQVGGVKNQDDSYAILALPAFSALCVDGVAANEWKHAVLPTFGERISLVFRSLKMELAPFPITTNNGGSSGGVETGTRGVLIWHRRDLRLGDNALYEHLAGCREEGKHVKLACMYVFDDAHYARQRCLGAGSWDSIRTGPFTCKFILQAVHDLRERLRDKGNDLMVFRGSSVEQVCRVAQALSAQVNGPVEVRFSTLAGSEETGEEEAVKRALRSLPKGRVRPVPVAGVETLWHPSDLPSTGEQWEKMAYGGGGSHDQQKRKLKARSYKKRAGGAHESSGAPIVMGEWRRAARDAAEPRLPTAAPEWLPGKVNFPPSLGLPSIPTLQELMAPALAETDRLLLGMPRCMVSKMVDAACRSTRHRGGESGGLQRIDKFVKGNLEEGANRSAIDTGLDGSSKLASYLAQGCVSPRQVYVAARQARLGSRHHRPSSTGQDVETSGKKSSSPNTSWLASHLEIRDFFIYSCKAMGANLFRSSPLKSVGWAWVDPSRQEEEEEEEEEEELVWRRFVSGRTGLPLVDACMRELFATGYCSNRTRQNVVSFLSRDLFIDWRCGAELFQWCLEDHDVSSNWGNWSYFAGVGADPKNRHFRTCSQGLQHDPHGVYVCKWVPELAAPLEEEKNPWHLHCPFIYGTPFSKMYPPIIDPHTQLSLEDKVKIGLSSCCSLKQQ